VMVRNQNSMSRIVGVKDVTEIKPEG
jgi:hypothetical protein